MRISTPFFPEYRLEVSIGQSFASNGGIPTDLEQLDMELDGVRKALRRA
jgi:hypothetical protein